MNYIEQLNRVEWKLKSYEIKKRDNFTCQICGKKEKLHVHHVQYEPNFMVWQYPGNYYITLCESCHLYEHSIIDNKPEYKEMLLSGMMGIDIFRKFKNNEYLKDLTPF